LEFLAALIAGRQALSLHSDGTIVVDGRERVGGEFRVYLGSLLPAAPAHRQLVGILKNNQRCPTAPTSALCGGLKSCSVQPQAFASET
jgi:hypothetical protein